MPKFNKKFFKFMLSEFEKFIERYEGFDADGTLKPKGSPMDIKKDAPDANEQPYDVKTVSVDESTDKAPAEINDTLEPLPEDSEAGVVENDLPEVDEDLIKTADDIKTPEDEDMIIKSTDGVGPDIEVSDAVNVSSAAIPDGKDITQAEGVDTSKINLPTDLGPLKDKIVNGPTPDDKPEGETMEPEEAKAPETEHTEDFTAPEFKPLPEDENQKPKADTKVTSTFEPVEIKEDAPVISPLQPEAETLAIPALDKPAEDVVPSDEQKEAFPTVEADEADKEVAPAPLGDDAAPSNAAAPSEVVKTEDDAEPEAVEKKDDASDVESQSKDQQPVADDATFSTADSATTTDK